MSASATYEVRVSGAVGPAARAAFADLAIDVEPTATVLSGDLDQAALHALIERIHDLGLQLVDIRRNGPSDGPAAPNHPQRP